MQFICNKFNRKLFASVCFCFLYAFTQLALANSTFVHSIPFCRMKLAETLPKTLNDHFVMHCRYTLLYSNKFLQLSTFFAAGVVYGFCVTPSTCSIVYFIPTAVLRKLFFFTNCLCLQTVGCE